MMTILSIFWMIVAIVVAAILWLKGNLRFTAAFVIVFGITFVLLLNQKWRWGLIGLCLCGILFYGVHLFEPNWWNDILNLRTILQPT